MKQDDDIENRFGGYVDGLVFNDETHIRLQRDDIVVFVGPNNVGKSRALRDIHKLLGGDESDSIIVMEATLEKEELPTGEFLEKNAMKVNNGGNTSYQVFGQGFSVEEYALRAFLNNPGYNQYRDLFCVWLGTSARLSICEPANSIRRDEPKTHPIHFAAFDNEKRQWLSDIFKRAFGQPITPNTQFGSVIPLCIGPNVWLGDEYRDKDEQTRMEAYAEILEKYPQAHNQGDGIKSFIGILLHLMLDYRRVYLIDEPESFLHPPQARIMGQAIGNTLSNNQQAFISTHSEDLIKGLLDENPERVKIIRITRSGDGNQFHILDNEELQDIWNDPLLKYSNIMASLFHAKTVLCESDSDCKFYSIIDDYLKSKSGRYSETLFIHCGGKQRMPKIMKALKSLGVDVAVIADIDFLNNKEFLRQIAEIIDVRWDELSGLYDTFSAQLGENDESLNRKDVKNKLNELLESNDSSELSVAEAKRLKSTIKVPTKWEKLKKSGITAISSEDGKNAFNRINTVLKSKGVHLVPVGELEGFIKEVGGHGPEWVNKVIAKFPDLNDEVYEQVKEFIENVTSKE